MTAPSVNTGNTQFPTPLEIYGKNPTIGISFFSGAMGLDLGLELGTGVKFLLAADSFPAARSTIRANRPGIRVLDDASRLTAAQVRKVAGLSADHLIDIVSGCPPCPPWSVAGKRLGVDDPRGILLPQFIDLAIALGPRLIIHENVKGLASAELGGEKGGLLRLLVHELRRNGYRVAWDVINAADFGTPQNRERLILLACRDAEPVMPVPTHSKNGSGGLPKWRTLRDALAGLPPLPCDHIEYSPGMMRYMVRLQAGQWWKHLPPDLRSEAVPDSYHKGGGGTGTLRRLSWDRPCPTITCSPAQKMTTLGHPDQDRPLSVQECMRVQGFPDDWRMLGSVSDRYIQTGNAVPVPLSTAVGRTVARTLGITEASQIPAEHPVEITLTQPARLSRHVSKKGEGVFAWAIRLPDDRCPFASKVCAKECFAKQGRVPQLRKRHEANYEFTKSDGFVDEMAVEIRREVDRAGGKNVSVCLHMKGELYSTPYAQKWREIMRRTSDCANLHYFIYTRSWTNGRFLSELRSIGEEFRNVRINLSLDRSMVTKHGVPERIGDGLVTWLADTDKALPPPGVDLVFRNVRHRNQTPLETLNGVTVCPNEAHLYFSRRGGKVVLQDGKPVRVTCGECRLCIDRSFAEWEKLKDTYRGNPSPNEPKTPCVSQVAPIGPASDASRGRTGTLRYIDLCCGIGGFRRAMDSLGGVCVMSSEIDDKARLVYHANYGEWPSGDICQIKGEDVPDHDFLCAGFPCQPFSICGKQEGFADKTRGTIFFEIARIIKAKQPVVVILENVPRLVTHDHGRTFTVIQETLQELGYVVNHAVLNASLYGSPTARKRVYIVAFRADLGICNFEFPKPSLEKVTLADVLLPDSEMDRWVSKHPKTIDEEIVARASRKTALKLIRVGHVGTITKAKQGYRVYSPCGHAVTFCAHGGGMGAKSGLYYINGRVRKLDPRECLRVMGYPDSFVIPPSIMPDQVRTLTGNTVVVPVVRKVCESIVSALAKANWKPTGAIPLAIQSAPTTKPDRSVQSQPVVASPQLMAPES